MRADGWRGAQLMVIPPYVQLVDDLKAVARKALQEVIDKALDDPAFRDAIAS